MHVKTERVRIRYIVAAFAGVLVACAVVLHWAATCSSTTWTAAAQGPPSRRASLASTPSILAARAAVAAPQCLDSFRPVSDKQAPGSPCASDIVSEAYATSPFVPGAGQGDGQMAPLQLGNCTRLYAVRDSILSNQGLRSVRCTSAHANAIRDSSSSHVSSARRSPPAHGPQASPPTNTFFPKASICVFYLNYKNLENLMTSVQTHAMRAHNPDIVSHTVLTMEEDEADVRATRDALGHLADVHRLTFPPGTSGGGPIPSALHLISLASSCPLTVVSDSDAFMLADGWDTRLLAEFMDPQLSLLAGNPRHRTHGGPFLNIAEWNWMAYRTYFLAGLIIGGPELVEPEAFYTPCVRRIPGTRMKLMQDAVRPYEGKAATVVTDPTGSPWIMHLFYSSRTKNEASESIKAEAARNSLSAEQLADLRRNLLRDRFVNMTSAFLPGGVGGK